MKKILSTFLCIGLAAALQGCTQQPKAATSQDAIQQSQTLKTTDDQVKYLVSQANSFINSQKFEDGIAVAKHILQNLDANSQEAKSLLEKASIELQKSAEKKVNEIKSDLNNKINSLGK
jgi:hypothetical protein